MYKFGKASRSNLEECHPDLQEIANEAIKYIDFSVICGHRNREDQNEAYDAGNSQLQWPESKHNKRPSLAMDIVPYPVDWNNIRRFAFLMGIIRGIAVGKGIKIRLGADWDMDGDITDHPFQDWPHVELVREDD